MKAIKELFIVNTISNTGYGHYSKKCVLYIFSKDNIYGGISQGFN